MKPVTSSTATGSFSPDSPSRARASRRRSFDPRSTAKIAAESVAAMAEPTISASSVPRSNSQAAASAPMTAVSIVPTTASESGRLQHRPDLLPAGRQPTLEQDQHQADRPQGPGQLDVVELDTAGALAAHEHAEAEEEDQPGHPDAVGDHRRGDPRAEQQAADQDQLCVGQVSLQGSGAANGQDRCRRPGCTARGLEIGRASGTIPVD